MNRRHNLATMIGLLIVAALLVVGASIATAAIVNREPTRDPGPQWVQDHGSTYWSCTSDGHELLKDNDTGSVVLAPNSRHCDSAG